MLVRERNIKYIKSNIRFRWPCYYMILKNKIKKIKLFHKRYKNKKIFYNLFVARSYNHNLRLRSHKFKLPRRRLFRINYRRRFLRKKLKIKKKKFSSKAINNKSLRFSYWKFHAYTSRRRRKLKKKSKFLKKWVFKKKKINKLFKSYIFKRRKYKFKRYYSYAMLALNNKINSLKTYRLFKNYIFNFTRYYSKLFKFDYANQLKWRFSRSKFNYFAFVQKIKNLYLFINSNIISAGSSFTSLDKSFINKFKKKFKLSKFMYFNKKIRIRRKRLFYNLKKLFSNKLFSNEFNKKLIFNKKFIKPLFKKK